MSRDPEQHSSAGSAERADPRVAYLDQALWSQLQNPLDFDAFGAAWLALLCQNIHGVRAGLLVLSDGADRRMRPVSVWPGNWTPSPPVMAAAEAALVEKAPIARAAQLDDDEGYNAPEFCQVAHPVIIDGVPAGVAALEIKIRPKREISLVLREIQWGSAWIEAAIRGKKDSVAHESLGRLRHALDLFAAMLDTRGVAEAANALATEFAAVLECDRVSIGIQRRQSIEVLAMSHSAYFDKRMQLVHSLLRIMEEAADQRAVISYPQDKHGLQTVREHEKFSEANSNECILTAPFRIDEWRNGVIVFERPAERPFSDEDIDLVAAVSALAGPVIEDRLDLDRPILVKLRDWGVGEVRKLTGPEHVGRKVFATVVLFLLAFFTFAFGTFHVTADVRMEGSVRRTIVAPIEGFVDDSSVRPGDQVAAGDILATLDTGDLRIERVQWLSEKRKASLEYARAMSSGERASLGVLSAQIAQADAQLELLDLQIERSTLKAPFDGVVVAGDLTQSIGASVSRGEVLFEIAPLNAYRVVAQVDERDIGFVKAGQKCRLILASTPGKRIPCEVNEITPVSTTEDGQNYFRVEAQIPDGVAVAGLRPGMEGVAKIDAGSRRLIWIWTREAVNWLRLAAWRWLP